jgi:hypothetical protein
MHIQALSYSELLDAHKSIELFSPELGYERAAAYMYYARISRLRSEQAALESFTAARDRLLASVNKIEEDLTNLDI